MVSTKFVFTKLRISSLDSWMILLYIWTHRQTLESLTKYQSPCETKQRSISLKRLLKVEEQTSHSKLSFLTLPTIDKLSFNMFKYPVQGRGGRAHLYLVRAWTSSVTDKNSAAGVVRVHSFYKWNITKKRMICVNKNCFRKTSLLRVITASERFG